MKEPFVMIAAALCVLAIAAAAPIVPAPHRVERWIGTAVAAIALAVAGAVAATTPEPVTGVPLALALVLSATAAATGGITAVPMAFRIARQQDSSGPEPAVLHGGLTIGILATQTFAKPTHRNTSSSAHSPASCGHWPPAGSAPG